MATTTLKRVREEPSGARPEQRVKKNKPNDSQKKQTSANPQANPPSEIVRKATLAHVPEEVVLQIAAGSYERVLHGITARIPAKLLRPDSLHDPTDGDDPESLVSFSDTFLFAAHTSSVRSLALSPPSDSQRRFLATGSTDERVNLYSLSTVAPCKPDPKIKAIPSAKVSLSGTITSENPLNRTLGALTHHSRPLTTLQFPSKSKLFSGAEDNTIAITRSRDWTLLSSIKAPIPNSQNRPSGDTAAPGDVPAGVNDFAVHPTQKVMLTVHRGERCMRLWNLMTGKKAGVLSFDREMLIRAGEGKHSLGEGRKVLWNADGEMFVVGFERGAVVYGVDSIPRAVIKATTKFHQMHFLPRIDEDAQYDVLAVSTEDGRVLFYDIPVATAGSDGKDITQISHHAQLGGKSTGLVDRIKDFEVLPVPPELSAENPPLLITTGNSDGAIRLWTVFNSEIARPIEIAAAVSDAESKTTDVQTFKQVGCPVGAVETGRRITCLGAFVMDASVNEGANGHVEAAFQLPGDLEQANGAEDQDDEGEDDFGGLSD